MNLRYAILAPALLTTAMATYIMAAPSPGPSEATAQPPAFATQPSSPTASGTPSTGPPPTSTPTPDVPNTLPAGLTGQLTYRTGRDQVTVQFPEQREVDRWPSHTGPPAVTSADGMWTADTDCTTLAGGARRCSLVLTATDGRVRNMQLDVDLQWSRAVQWSPTGHRLALLVSGEHGSRIAVLNDPDPAAGGPDFPQPEAPIDAPYVTAFSWASDGQNIIAARTNGLGFALVRIDAERGGEHVVAKLVEPVNFLYPSPDRSMVAFTGNSLDGWHLLLFDERRLFAVRDLGSMGSDGPNATPVSVPPDVKGPMYIAWSPDGSKLAFGGGYDPPYMMTIVDNADGTKHRTDFPNGYPGEIKWSPDGTRLAVSTYNIGRTHHESYVVDPETGVARDVLSGCVIVWSPDSRFLAIHGERDPGVIIADVATLQHSQLTRVAGDAPLRWER